MFGNNKGRDWGKWILLAFAIIVILGVSGNLPGMQSVINSGREVYSNPYETPTGAGGYLNLKPSFTGELFAIFPSVVTAGTRFSGKWQHRVDQLACENTRANEPSLHIQINGPVSYHDSQTVFTDLDYSQGAVYDKETGWEYTFPQGIAGGASSLDARVYNEESGSSCSAISNWDSTVVSVQGAPTSECSGAEKVYTYRCITGQIQKRVSPDGQCTQWTNVGTVNRCVTSYSDNINDFSTDSVDCITGQFKCVNGFVQKCAQGDSLLYLICGQDEVCDPLRTDWIDTQQPDNLCQSAGIGGGGPGDDPFEPSWNLIDGECVEDTYGTGRYTSLDQCRAASGDSDTPAVGNNSSGSSGNVCSKDTTYKCSNGKSITTYKCVNGVKQKTTQKCGDTVKPPGNKTGINKTTNKTIIGEKVFEIQEGKCVEVEIDSSKEQFATAEDCEAALTCRADATNVYKDGKCVKVWEDQQSQGIIVGAALAVIAVVYFVRRKYGL